MQSASTDTMAGANPTRTHQHEQTDHALSKLLSRRSHKHSTMPSNFQVLPGPGPATMSFLGGRIAFSKILSSRRWTLATIDLIVIFWRWEVGQARRW